MGGLEFETSIYISPSLHLSCALTLKIKMQCIAYLRKNFFVYIELLMYVINFLVEIAKSVLLF